MGRRFEGFGGEEEVLLGVGVEEEGARDAALHDAEVLVLAVRVASPEIAIQS